MLLMIHGAKDGIKNAVELAPDILRQEAQHKIAVLLQQDILASVGSV